jgi:hypothetical protein
MKHQYVDATTGRFIKWFEEVREATGEPPTFNNMIDWLSDREDYRNPLNAMRNLCVGLRQKGQALALQWIANVLTRELEDERAFGDTAERFFNAMVRRCGVEDSEVHMFDGHVRAGTLHDLGLAKKEATDA